MPLFIRSKEFSGQDTELDKAIGDIPTKEVNLSAVHDSETLYPIQLFPRQAVFLDASSFFKTDSSTSYKQLNSVYIPDFHNGLMLHVRCDDTSSYTAHIDPFTTVNWRNILDLFLKRRKEGENLRFEVDLGYMKIEGDESSYKTSSYLISQVVLSLFVYIKDKSIDINFIQIHRFTNTSTLDNANCINLMIDVATGTLSICGQRNKYYYPLNLFPIDKALMTIKLCDYSSLNEVLLIYDINTSPLKRERFEQYCLDLSNEYREALSNYKGKKNYDLSFLMDYFKGCLYRLLPLKFSEEDFNRDLLFYMKCASLVFTGLKIFPDIMPPVVPAKPSSAFLQTRKRSASDGDITVQKEKISKEAQEENKPLLAWLKPSAALTDPIIVPAEDSKISNPTGLSKTPS